MSMRKLRRHRNKKQVHLAVGLIVFLLTIMTVGYAAFSTNITLNARGNVIAASNASFGGITVRTVQSGDGLYDNGNNTYTYKGGNPNNYIMLGDEEYRIMAVETNGTLKVIRNEKINDSVIDPGYATSIAGVTSANSMTGTRWSSASTDYCYYNGSATTYFGCKVWSKQIVGNSTETEGVMLDSLGRPISVMPREAGSSVTYTLPTTDSYINTYLNTTYLNSLLTKLDSSISNKIEVHTFNVGPVRRDISSDTLSVNMSQEEAYKWKGKVGLMTSTDYVKGSNNSACTSVYEYNNTSGCYSNSTTHNYLTKSSYNQWTMSPISNSLSYFAHYVTSSGRMQSTGTHNSFGIRPVLYLSSDILLSGSGTQQNPYTISSSGSGVPIGGGDTPSGSNTIVYAFNSDTKIIGTSTITNGASNYTNLLPFFLKYEIDSNNVIQKAWVCNNFDTLSTPICLQGGNSSYHSDNISTLMNLSNNSEFNSSYGTCNSSFTECNYDTYYYIQTSSDGSVLTWDENGLFCQIDNDGGSIYCGS